MRRDSGSQALLFSPVALPLIFATTWLTGVGLSAQRTAVADARVEHPLRSVSLVSADFDEDGVSDLAIGSALERGGSISLMRGDLDAIAPQTQASWLAAGRHEPTVPFLEPTETIHLDVVPDMLAAADVNGDGHVDLVYASKNSGVLHFMIGTGKGAFLPNSISFTLPGSITALAAYRPGAPVAGEVLVVGYETRQGSRLAIVSYRKSGPKIESTYKLPGVATAFSVANLDDDLVPDTAIVAGGQLLVLHGRNALAGAGRLEALPVDGVEAVTAGEFVFDRHGLTQLAALTSDGDVLILAHQGIDLRPFTPQEVAGARHLRPGSPTLAQLAGDIGNEPWTVAETNSQVAAHTSDSQTPILLRARSSGSWGDDVVVLNPSEQQRVTISHHGGTSKTPAAAAARTSAAGLSSSDELVAAAAVRVSADGRQGVAMLEKNSPRPEFTVPSAGNTYFVNTTADNTGTTTDTDDGTRCSNGSAEVCTLRDAVTFVNNDAADNISASKSDAIMLPAGTYPLTWQAGTVDSNGNAVTHLEILGPVTFVGTTSGGGVIINASSNDVAFSINPGAYGSFNPTRQSYVFDTTMENLTIQNGRNPNNLANNANANDVGGGINWDAYGTGNLTLTNVNINNCTVLYGPGGGIWAQNSVGSGSGTITLNGGLITKNTTAEEGGGIYVAYPYAAVVATNTDIYENSATATLYPSDPGAFGAGGGLYFSERTSSAASPQSTLTGVVIDKNSASQEGGGIYTNSGILLRSSLVAANTSGAWGGGVYAQEGAGEASTTITSTQIIGNSATTTGGGLFVGDGNPSSDFPSLVVSLSRISGNASASGTTGLALSGVGAATATENWWGCNAGPAAAPCDVADSAAVVSPWAVLKLSATQGIIVLGSSGLFTVSLDTDSNGNSITGAFPAVIGEAVTFNVTGVTVNPALTYGYFSNAGTVTATLTPTTSGDGILSATFDNQTLSLNFVSAAPAALTTPTPGNTLTSTTVTFDWTAPTGATGYLLHLGSTGAGSSNLDSSGQITGNTVTFNALPANGETIYARLFTYYGTASVSADYTYTAITATAAALTTPTPGSTFTSNTVTFDWSAVTGATKYLLELGTTGVGSSNVYTSGGVTGTSATATGLPGIGETVYARLFTYFGTTAVSADFTYTDVTQSTLTTPTPGSTFTSTNVTFDWTAATGATKYLLHLGTTGVGSSNVYSSGGVTGTTATAVNLPGNGETIYVRLYTYWGTAYATSDYTYTDVTQSSLTTPTPSSTFTSTSVTFDWKTAAGATKYLLHLGSTGVGSSNLDSSGQIAGTTFTFSSLPSNGETIYARLFTYWGTAYAYSDYTYTALTATAATLNSPTPGSTLVSPSTTFGWTAVTGATKYLLELGTTGVGSSNLYNSGGTTGTTATANSLPGNGETIYARLYTYFGTVSVYNDTTYTDVTQSVLTTPTPGSAFTSTSVTFDWTTATGATKYLLHVGSTGVGSSNLDSSGQITGTTVTFTGLPNNGETIYVRLYTYFGTASAYTDYTYTAQ